MNCNEIWSEKWTQPVMRNDLDYVIDRHNQNVGWVANAVKCKLKQRSDTFCKD